MSETSNFSWPNGKRSAVSITFDDARESQVEFGLPILDRHNVKATFYVSLQPLEQRLDAWLEALDSGHEIGNHTASHPCSGNFPFARSNALEDFTLDRMADELDRATAVIERLTKRTPSTFAYPCGQTFVGRGETLQSYIPLAADRFTVARAAYNEVPNDPGFCDLANAAGLSADDVSFEYLKSLVDAATDSASWLILYGHNVGEGGHQTVRADALDALCDYLTKLYDDVWTDTVAAVGGYIQQVR